MGVSEAKTLRLGAGAVEVLSRGEECTFWGSETRVGVSLRMEGFVHAVPWQVSGNREVRRTFMEPTTSDHPAARVAGYCSRGMISKRGS